MTGPALALAIALAVVFIGALLLDWWENRRDWREWREDNPTPEADELMP